MSGATTADGSIAAAYDLFSRHRREVGYVMRPSLARASERGELYVAPGAAAYVWRRRDGITTLHAICSEVPGGGSALLSRIVADSRTADHTAILARCPEGLPANEWYPRRGFAHDGIEPGRGRSLIRWRLAL